MPSRRSAFLRLAAACLFASIAVSLSSAAAAADTETPEFVRVQAGEFKQGLGAGQSRGVARDVSVDHPFSIEIGNGEVKGEFPAHTVQLTRDFDLGKHEVTVGQFRDFVKATGFVTDAEKNGTMLGFDPDKNDTQRSNRDLHFERFRIDEKYTWKTPGFEIEDAQPVVGVSFRDAQAYCDWLSKTREGTFRLPTEAEWEYACKAGTKTWYSCGNDPDCVYEHANVADAALEAKHPMLTKYQRVVRLKPGEGDGFAYPAPVGSFKPNPWGLYDMHGNVWEWTTDLYADRHYADRVKQAAKDQGVNEREVVVVDPTGPDTTEMQEFGDWHTLRGGGWNVAPLSNRSSMRAYGEAGDAFCYVGFRVVREVD